MAGLHSVVSVLNPSPSPPADVAAPTSRRPVLTTRRSSQRGVAMPEETRPPRELLMKIGISGKEVVKIIEENDWVIEEPHGLQQQKLYYLPGVKENKGEQLTQNEDFFVGEGELYAFILKQGGIRYLLPDEDLSTESDESEVEPTQPARSDDEASVEESDAQDNSSASDGGEAPTGSQRRWKRRKRLSTARSKSSEKSEKNASTGKTPAVKRRRESSKKNAAAQEEEEDEDIRVNPRVKLEQVNHVEVGQQAEFSQYESSLTARGWRAQLLQDVDVHLLRSVAAIDRRNRAQEATEDGQKRSARPAEGVGPHARDAAEVLHELDGLMKSIRASQDDLSSMIETIIAQAERLAIPDRIDPVGRIGIPNFVATDTGRLVLMRDIERYLLLVVAAVRRYQRSRKTFRYIELAGAASRPSSRAVKRADLRALQLRIEESKSELQEVAAIVSTEAARSCQDMAQESAQTTSQSTSQSTSQGASQSTSRTMDCDGDVDTDQDQASSQQSAASPQRLEGVHWFV